MPKCLPTGGVSLQEVSVSGGSTVLLFSIVYNQLKNISLFVEHTLLMSFIVSRRLGLALVPGGGGGALPYIGYIGMCRCEG